MSMCLKPLLFFIKALPLNKCSFTGPLETLFVMIYLGVSLIALITSTLVMSQQLPKVLPLAVKSPYLNYWSHDPLVRADWPMFWTNKVCTYSFLLMTPQAY